MRAPRSLRARLLLANLVVAGAVLGAVVLVVSLVGPDYFVGAMGHQPGDPMGSMMAAATSAAFDEAMRDALLVGGFIALVTSVVVSVLLSGAIAGPVTRLAIAARSVAAGHHDERVPEADPGELGELAVSFNAMTTSLQETESRRLQLVGDVAHELRTPLATLDGYLEGLQDGVIVPAPQTWQLLRLETARMTRLVNDLQELWRAESHQLPLRIGSVAASQVIARAVDRIAPLALTRGIELDVEVPDALEFRADSDRAAQIVENFLSNAVRYGPDRVPVTVRARRSGDTVEIAVTDQGPGLTPEQRRLVFERFYRVDPARSRALGGSGIGLAIARALAEAMGGSVAAESAGPGTGSTFVVRVPAASAQGSS
jgi:two-component system, OmpR family, sensor histidine kinase BaeS